MLRRSRAQRKAAARDVARVRSLVPQGATLLHSIRKEGHTAAMSHRLGSCSVLLSIALLAGSCGARTGLQSTGEPARDGTADVVSDAPRDSARDMPWWRRDVGGPRADGPRADGSRADGPRADGPRADGPRADGPRADGPRADGPRADGPMADAPRTDGPVADAPRADAPEGDRFIWPDTPNDDLWPKTDGYSQGSPFGCSSDLDCFHIKCCPTPWGVKLCMERCP